MLSSQQMTLSSENGSETTPGQSLFFSSGQGITIQFCASEENRSTTDTRQYIFVFFILFFPIDCISTLIISYLSFIFFPSRDVNIKKKKSRLGLFFIFLPFSLFKTMISKATPSHLNVDSLFVTLSSIYP